MIIFQVFYKFLPKFYHHIHLFKNQIAWRNTNKHNHTTIENVFKLNDIHVGNHTYGPLIVYRWGSQGEKLQIGNFCSIASGVKFILGGNHDTNVLSTYPFEYYFNNKKLIATTKGPIIIGDDVWIGTDVTILSGVKIGKGSVISAGSIVTKDIENYSIVGGIPAKLIKKRFSDAIIREIEEVDFSSKNFEENIIHNLGVLNLPIDEDSLQTLKNKLYKE